LPHYITLVFCWVMAAVMSGAIVELLIHR
jgi:hypothetical protein